MKVLTYLAGEEFKASAFARVADQLPKDPDEEDQNYDVMETDSSTESSPETGEEGETDAA